jgi:hypothetical protein
MCIRDRKIMAEYWRSGGAAGARGAGDAAGGGALSGGGVGGDMHAHEEGNDVANKAESRNYIDEAKKSAGLQNCLRIMDGELSSGASL